MADGPLWLCFSSRKLGDAARTWLASKIWVVVQKIKEMIHFISPQHLQVRHILNVMASGPILPKVGKVNILWLFLLQFEILPATFAGALRRQCGFQSFLGKVQKSFSREYSYKGKPYHDPKVRFCSLNIAFLVKNGIFTNRWTKLCF